MTIAAAYLTSEGVVLGADSATTITQLGTKGVAQLFNHAQKIFEIGPPGAGRLATCTWGAGMVGKASHRTIAARLADAVTINTTVEDASKQLTAIVMQELGGLPASSFGYYLGGWNPGTHLPECYELTFEQGKQPASRMFSVGEASFQASPEMFIRAYYGVDPRIPDLVLAELQQQLKPVPPNLGPAVESAFKAALSKIPTGGHTDMPIREAIDFVHMYLHLTVKAFKFRFGPPVVGGPIEIGFVSSDRNFRWVRHKAFDSAILEEEAIE